MTGTSGLASYVEFCGEQHPLSAGRAFSVGRDGDLKIDDNPYLHRQFLQLDDHDSMWWLTNVGTQLTATIADERGSLQAWLAPGARIPLVFGRTIVWFTAGSTTYEFEVVLDQAPFIPIAAMSSDVGQTTVGPADFTPDQKLLVVALCEDLLRKSARAVATVPSSAEAASRLGWTLTRFNRKLDNVCQKLTRAGVQGLHGGPESLAVNRRARLVEYALATRLVDKADLGLLES